MKIPKLAEILVLGTVFMFAVYSAVLISQTTWQRDAARDNHLVLLAQQFTRGEVSLSPLGLPHGDYVDAGGKQYLYFGPLPSAILAPFAAIYGRSFPQNVLGFASLILAFSAVIFLARKFNFNRVDAVWLAIFFSFSTVLFFVSVVNISAYQVQSLGTMFVLFSLVEIFGKRRFWLIGSLIALAALTRITLFLTLFFPFFLARHSKKSLVSLFVPVFLTLILLGAYNYKRFHAVFQTGYGQNVTLGRYPMSANLAFGQFSLRHLPANLYSLLIRSPDPIVEKGGGLVLKFPYLKVDPWGIALWFTSPLFLLIFQVKKSRYLFPLLTTTILLLLPSVLYFGIGYSQFGYRYALDFLPFLFTILMTVLTPRLSFLAKFLIVVGVLFNSLYITSIWGFYPHLGIFNQ